MLYAAWRTSHTYGFCGSFPSPSAIHGRQRFVRRVWAETGVWACLQRARRFVRNPIGLSCVKLDRIEWYSAEGPLLYISGADLLNDTPIYDIKPYLPFTDSHPEAAGGFADDVRGYRLSVDCPNRLLDSIPTQHRQAVMDILAQDPRPSYQQDAERVYGMEYAGMEIRFTVNKDLLTVLEIIRKMPDKER